MKDLKILKELRKGPLQSMKDDEYAMIEEQVTKMGIDGLNGYAKRMIEKGMREMAYSMKDTVKKHQEHDQSSHGSWAGDGAGGSASETGAPRKIGYNDLQGTSKQGSVTTTPSVLDKLFGKGERVEGDEFERKVTEAWAFEMTNPTTGKSFKAEVYDWMRYDSMNLTAEQGQKLAPMGRSESGKFSVGALSREDAKVVEDYIASNSTMNKATSVAQGDMVSWNSSGGTARGKVIRVVREGKINVPDSSFEINAEEGDPAVLIQLYRDGKPTDTKVGHKMSTLKKNFDLAKHGDHNQSSHGNWSNDDDSEGEDESEPKNPKPKFVAYDDDSEGEFADLDADDPRWMDDMDILRPPKRKS
jgi:hypothetical protein